VNWITKKNALPVLYQNPYLDRVWEWNDENRLILQTMKFDVLLNADKNQNSCAFTMQIKASEKLGFGLDDSGVVIPLNKEADYNYRMGLDDELKFRENKRTGLDILAETWKLNYQRDEYVLILNSEEKQFCETFRHQLNIPDKSFVVGLNTGCSIHFPQKRMSVEQHVELARRIANHHPDIILLLLGGFEDTERNDAIKKELGDLVIETPTTHGLRSGILYENLCDLVVSGDSLGMHIAIGLKKIVIAWFGLSCNVEIDLFNRGEKILSELECSPCWNPQCSQPQCLEDLDLDNMVNLISKYYNEARKGRLKKS
jgi:heptosyltransferase-2